MEGELIEKGAWKPTMKKLIILICVALLTLVPLSNNVLANTSGDTSNEVVFQPGNNKYQINEQEFTMDTAPFIAGGRIYVPVDFLGYALGTGDEHVNWRVGTGEVNLVIPVPDNSFLEIKMQNESNQLVIDYLNNEADKKTLEVTHSKTVSMDVTPLVKEGQVYLPVRWVAEACGFTVAWDGSAQRVLLSAPGTENPAGDNSEEITGGIKINTREIKSSSAQMELNMEIPVISGLVDQALQEQINKQILDQAMQTKTELDQSYAELAESAKVSGFPLHTFQLFISYETYTSGDVVSLVVETYQYAGGAHGGAWRDFYNLDTKNGKLLTLQGLFKDSTDYITVINGEIQKHIAARIKSGQDMYFEGEMGFKSIAANHPFYIKDSQLILHFGQYEIAPYAAGMPEFAVPLTSLTQQLQEGFQQLLL